MEQRKKERLKKIAIHGFKSFADPVEISFIQGIHAIVGPNGCGKSNIADAFLWVLGEQSAKSLRGSKMQDVIFAGSATRKPIHRAEVTVTFSNEDKFLPIEYEEVAITRRLYRDGDSEYLVNNNPIRLKDIHELFLHSGVGKEAFAIIGQGKVEELIHQEPKERRAIFEDVAGILHFLKERSKARDRLELSSTNLLRVQDMCQEIGRQVKTLEKQAKVAKEFKKHKQDLEEAEKAFLWKRYTGLETKQKKLQEELHTLDESFQKSGIDDTVFQEKLLKEKQEHKALKSALEKLQEKIREVQSGKEITLKEIEHISEEIKKAQEKEKALIYMVNQALQEEKRLQLEKENQHKKVQLCKEALDTAGALYNKNFLEAEECEKASLEILKAQKELSESRFREQAKIHALETDRKKCDLQLELIREKIGEKEVKISQMQKMFSQIEREYEGKKDAAKVQQEKVNEQKNLLQKSISDIQALEEERKGLRLQGESKKKELLEHEAEHHSLSKLKEEYVGFSQGVKVLLAEIKKKESPLHGKAKLLAEVLEAGLLNEEIPESIHVLEKLYASTLVVACPADASMLREIAQAHKVQDFSFLILSTLDGYQETGDPFVLGKKLLQTYFFSFAAAASVEEALTLLQQGGKCPIWISQGGFIDPNRVLFWGAPRGAEVFLREKKLHTLKEKIEGLKKEYAVIEEALSSVEKSFLEKTTFQKSVETSMRKDDMTFVEINFMVQKLENEKAHCVSEKKQCEESLSSLKENFEKQIEEIKEKERLFQENKELFLQSEVAFKRCEEELFIRREHVKRVQAEKEGAYKQYEEARLAYQREEHAVEILSMKAQECLNTKERNEREKETLLQIVKDLLDKKGGNYKAVENKELALSALQKEMQEHVHKIVTFEEKIMASEQSMKEVVDIQGKILQQKAKYEGELGNLIGMLTMLSQELMERHTLEFSHVDVLPEWQELSVEALEQRCKKLRQVAGKEESINFMAEQEYEECLARHALLQEQVVDIQKAKEELERLINHLEQDTKKRFTETFTQVQEAFCKNFSILFNGGEADIRLEENMDVLDAGVEIFAKPPGKQMRSLALLSGGEKCLTAIALLFSLFEVRPSPFCILDEVDAPLDETNVERYAKLVKSFSSLCQFLVVTHNKRTMSLADVLIGVSMQEKGVTQLISLDFKKLEVEEKALT